MLAEEIVRGEELITQYAMVRRKGGGEDAWLSISPLQNSKIRKKPAGTVQEDSLRVLRRRAHSLCKALCFSKCTGEGVSYRGKTKSSWSLIIIYTEVLMIGICGLAIGCMAVCDGMEEVGGTNRKDGDGECSTDLTACLSLQENVQG